MWTAPYAGSFAINATFTGEQSGSDANADVLKNGSGLTPLLQEYVGGMGTTASYTGVLQLTAGDTIDFAVGALNNRSFGAEVTQLDASISSVVPEPATLATRSLLGGLGIAAGWWRRKRAP